MERDKLLKIIEFHRENSRDIQTDLLKFYDLMGRDSVSPIPNIQTMAGYMLEKSGYKLFRIPLKSKEIGAFQLKLNGARYVVLNTAQGLAYNNFALCHELYHTLIQEEPNYNSAEVYMEGYEDNPAEMRANAFAGCILMPSEDFIITNHILDGIVKKESDDMPDYSEELLRIFTLMDNYRTTYMSVVIQCYKEEIFDISNADKMDFLLKFNDEKKIRKLFYELSKIIHVDGIMEATKIDDFRRIYEEAKRLGESKRDLGIITEEDLRYQLAGLNKAYKRVVVDSDDN